MTEQSKIQKRPRRRKSKIGLRADKVIRVRLRTTHRARISFENERRADIPVRLAG